ncbi:MAG: AAA family ATPase [Clostridia bacterium]|nr:AAA family ATPase [Clostridia bacterium]
MFGIVGGGLSETPGWRTEMIGREPEKSILTDCLNSKRPEFVVVCGRRRVGKTYLIKEFFQEQFAFYATGVTGINTRKQLRVFHEALLQYGSKEKALPRDWFDAFSRLKDLLSSPEVRREYQTGKKVVFLDELPWMDTARSDFKSALDYFWNSWASTQRDLLLIVCGSAASWIIGNIVMDTGGFFNRITRQIHLMPFTLYECEQLLLSNGIQFSLRQVIECYMILGGIPYYLNYLKPQYSLAQNIDMLFFQENGPLRNEYDLLFRSLFRRPAHHMAIIEALSSRKSGLTRAEMLEHTALPEGKELTRCLSELEQCGFVRKYTSYPMQKQHHIYQLTDSLTLFHLTWIQKGSVGSWMETIGTPAYYAWCGLAFERICMLHVRQIKNRLGILGVSSHEYAWRSRKSTPGAQIDLLIDRKDDVINLCEIKFASEEFEIDASCEKELIHKAEAFREETGTRKAVQLTMITLHGVKNNAHKSPILHEITGIDLLKNV